MLAAARAQATRLPFQTLFARTRRSMASAAAAGATHGASEPVVLLDQAPAHVRHVTLNRPKQLNALNTEVCLSMHAALSKWEADPSVCGVVVTGAGEKAFCAGGDVRSLYDAGKAGDYSVGSDFFNAEYTLDYLIGTYTKPICSIVDGITMGGGVGVSMHGRYVVATERTLFAMPEAALGLFPDVGASHFLTKTRASAQSPPSSVAMAVYLGLTGARLKGAELKRLGLATHFVPSASVPDLIGRLKSVIATGADVDEADRKINDVLREFEHGVDDAIPEDSVLHCGDAIERCFSKASVEAIVSELTASTAAAGREGDWARASLKAIEGAAPVSLKVTLQQMIRAKSLPLNKVFQMDYRMATQFVRGKTFYEGVRSILVDKDRNPKWEPSTLAEVSDADVERYFTEPEGGDIDIDETRLPGFFSGKL